MNRLRTTILLAGLLLTAAAVGGVAQPRSAHTATAPTGRTITVTGNGSVTTAPDRATFLFGVTTKATTAREALARNSATASSVIAALKAAGVASADLQTVGISLSPQTTPDRTKIVGYTASNTVRARIGLDKAGGLVDAAVGAGADSVSGPSLDLADQSALYRQALKQAVANAKAKAQALADAAGVSLGAVRSIDEGSSPTPVPFAPNASSGAATPIEPGTQEVGATVTVVYAVG